MRDRSLGAVPPLRASLRIPLHLCVFFGLGVCWIPISAHSITELPAPMSLSPYPVDLRTWTLGNSRWIANRDVRFKSYFAYFPGANLDSACPAQGSASMWALMEGPTQRKFWYPRKMP